MSAGMEAISFNIIISIIVQLVFILCESFISCRSASLSESIHPSALRWLLF